MNKEIDFETYLIISYGKFEIFLLDIKNHKDIYQEEFKFRDASEKLDFNLLNDFLENNIFKIEKLAGNFINSILTGLGLSVGLFLIFKFALGLSLSAFPRGFLW